LAIFATFETAHRHLEAPALDLNRLAIDQGIGELTPGGLQHPVEGRPRNPHHMGAFLLF
jgi:hypothetical protein